MNKYTFLVEYPEEDDPVTPCMDSYKSKIHFYVSLDKLELIISVRGDLQDKELVGYTWSQIVSMRKITYFFADATKHKARFHQ